MKIGFIGLGAMGRHMAANLQRAGHQLQVYDLRPVDGFSNTKSVREAAQGCELLFTSLPGPAEVEAVGQQVEGPLTWFDTSTNSPTVIRRIHAQLQKKRIQFLDAPVSGGPTGAQSGKLAIWVGGDEAVFQKYSPILKVIGDQPLYVGPIGAGTVAKLAHNAASFAVQAALAEIFTLGVKGGVEPLALFKALRQGASGRKRTFDRLAEYFLPGKYDPAAFSLRLAHKDVTLAMELAKECGVPMKIGAIALEELNEGMKRGWSERDCRVTMTLQTERSGGVDVHVPPEKLRQALAD
jgi:3-hydroxyisobutyrate dehydrogenase-like beta-hydroxyacid dehydrogenase